ncbi:MAG: signal recognition particle protein [Dehalococcoidia bacterium]|nr:signal recognition particle protein [Dehalococcoidia bacterium]
MFETLSEKLNGIFYKLGNKGRLTEKDIDASLREVRMALLEADVNFRVARQLASTIKERALAEDLLTKLTPGQQVVKITQEELTNVLTGGSHRLENPTRQPGVILVAGLNGAGKTTLSAKLARHLQQAGQSSMLVAADLHRPAAIDQLETLAGQVGVQVFTDRKSRDTVRVAKDGIARGRESGINWVIVDTAGRFQVDTELMDELESVHDAATPTETLLVLDAMTGQEAVRVAEEFHERLNLTGLVLTKMDGDARGGAALSITKVTGIPIKFIGTGERIDALEQMHPDRLASRILGMGDVESLIEKAQLDFDEERAMELDRKLRQARFDLEDFLEQLQQLKKMGPMSQILEMVPGFSSVKGRLNSDQLNGDNLRRVEAIIYSMTPQERKRPEIISGSRRRRIARGSGTSPREVNQLLNQFRQMQKMMRQMSTGRGRDQMMKMLGG